MRRLLVLFASLALIGALSACGSDDGSDGDASDSTTTAAPDTTADGATTTEADTTTTTEAPGAQVGVRTYFVRGEDVATAGRTVEGPAVGRGAIEALLAGPDATSDGDMSTEIPEGTELLDLDIAEGVATVDLSEQFVSGGGSLSMQLRVAQVVFTLTQFPTVEEVVFLIDGDEPDGLGGEGLPTRYEGRSALTDVTPLILVETPTPGAEVSGTFTVSGMSNTFEANVLYEVTDDQGGTLADGFTTATAGTGTWGTFEFETDLGDHTGPVTLTVFDESMEDGSRVAAYEVPLVAT